MTKTKKVHVEVQKDHLNKVAGGQPIPSLAESIWNALDADATEVSIFFKDGDLGIDEIVIQDNGHGIDHKEAEELFKSLGGSWKKNALFSKTKNRYLHGQEGKGRFKVFALGRVVDWEIRYKSDNVIYEYQVAGKADNIDYFNISSPTKSHSLTTGVTVKISELVKQFKLLDEDYTVEKLSPLFAVYLSQYKDTSIRISGQKIDPSQLIANRTKLKLDSIQYEDKEYEYELEIIEWNIISEKELLLCNQHGFPLERYEKQIRGIGDNSYSAYLKSDHISKLNEKGLLSLADLEPSLRPIIENAEKKIKEHFVNKKLEESSSIIDAWKEEEIYPYYQDTKSLVDEAERKVFDIVAINVSENIPEFASSDKKSKAFHLRLLRQAIEKSPDELQTILTEVLQLSKDKQSELAELLQETSLTSIISASKMVSDRLKFISGIENLIFNPETKKILKERSQLHKILATNTWVFGDAFSLSVNDQSLTEVLKKHRKLIGDDTVIDAPVKRLDGKTGIVDLMLSRTIARNHADESEHLVVELKAPSVKIGQKEIGQIENYAFAVAEDERFRHIKTKWTFWAISTDLDDFAKRKRNQKGFSDGVIYRSDDSSSADITILVKTWSEVFQECKHRLEFIRTQLNINVDSEMSLNHLKEKYAEYTKGVLIEQDEPEAS